jgi:hypothetical protein
VQDEVIYRCIHAACARQLPRQVNFCPYCGTGQHAGVDKPAHALPKAAPLAVAPAPVPAAPMAAPPAAPAKPVPAPAPAKQAPAAQKPAAPRPAAKPPQREPVRTRYWVIALILLWLIWMTARPSQTRQIDARIDQAIALSRECKSGEAQAELIALRSTKASPAQLARLQQAINAEAASCERTRQRGTAHNNAQSARNLVADAQRAMGKGDYRTAIDKMEVCVTMVDGGSRECGAVKARAEKLLCEQNGDTWFDGRCQ